MYLFLRKNSQVLVVILCVFHQPIIYAENSRALAEKNKRDMIYLCGDVKKLLKINLQLDKKVFKAKAPIHAQLEFSNISGRRLQVVNLDKVSDIALPSQVISLIFVNPAGNVISYAGPVLEFYPNNIRTWLEVDEIRNFSLTINEAGFQQFIIPVGGTYKISGSYFGLAAPNKQLCPPVAFVSSSFKIIN